ncbi:MAG: hypothetical protein GF331_24970 [Chitinivibrionales bacterium]|nr:hypothetical protein [Chitinivibrionales bacterium]
MTLKYFVFALLASALVTSIYVTAFRHDNTKTDAPFLFIFVLLLSWGAGLWFTPFSSAVWAASWKPVGFVAFIAVLLVIASARGLLKPSGADAEHSWRSKLHKAFILGPVRWTLLALSAAAATTGVLLGAAAL